MSRGASGISEGGDSRAGGRSSWIRSRLTPNRSSSLVIHIFATTPPSSTHHLAREDRPRDVLRPPIFYQIFRPPDFHENSTRSSPSILKIKLSIDRYENEVPLHHLHEKKQKQLRLQRTCFSNRKKKEKPRNKLLFGQNYRPFPWKLVHAVRKDGEKAIWRVKF